MAPPSDLVVIGLVWRALTRVTLVVDAHSNAVIDASSGRRRTTRWLRRADLVVVTTARLAQLLAEDGVRALPLHDPPLEVRERPASGQVVMPASWYADEPWQDVLAAAAQLPDVRFAVTGRPPADVEAPSNVRLTGYLPAEEYDELITSASAVLALTTRDDTMQRAAYEAVAAGRPVVASGTRALREYLTRGAVFADGGADRLAEAVRVALRDEQRLAAEMVVLRQEHQAAFEADLAVVQSAVRGAT
jgi:glycosyltransferase involved in cell wall biosynthesis